FSFFLDTNSSNIESLFGCRAIILCLFSWFSLFYVLLKTLKNPFLNCAPEQWRGGAGRCVSFGRCCRNISSLLCGGLQCLFLWPWPLMWLLLGLIVVSCE